MTLIDKKFQPPFKKEVLTKDLTEDDCVKTC